VAVRRQGSSRRRDLGFGFLEEVREKREGFVLLKLDEMKPGFGPLTANNIKFCFLIFFLKNPHGARARGAP
jgi:hypothetical protein